MQELIEFIDKHLKTQFIVYDATDKFHEADVSQAKLIMSVYNHIRAEAQVKLEKEKEHIINSYRKGRYNESPFIDSNEAEAYYNQNYNQKNNL